MEAMTILNSELFWVLVWALVHIPGLIAMVVLRRRSLQQLRVAERWHSQAAITDQPDARDLVLLTQDRHRRNGALVIVISGYLLLGILALIATLTELNGDWYIISARVLLVGGEIVLVGSAWMSVLTGDQIVSRVVRD